MKTIKLFLLGVCLIPNLLFAQVQQDWVQRYDGPGAVWDYAYSIAVDASGNVYVGGTSWGSGTAYDYCTIKYNSAGVQQWVARVFGPGAGDDHETAMVVDAAGNVYVTGYLFGGGSGSDFDFGTIKYNTNGVQQWLKKYNGPQNGADGATAIAIDAAGNVYVTGYDNMSTASNYATVKYNSSGVQQWSQIYNGPGNSIDMTTAIGVDNDGNVYITGYSYSGTFSSSTDYCTIKYNSSGVQQWVQRYNGLDNDIDQATSLAVDASGNVYITGFSRDYGIDYVTIKYNTNGVQQWLQRFDGGSTDQANCIKLDAAGNVYITGWGYYFGEDYVTIKYNNSGVQQWLQRYDFGLGSGTQTDKATSLAVDTSGNVYVTGGSYGGATNYDYATLKYNTAGIQQWVVRYTSTASYIDQASAIAVDASGNVYVTGNSMLDFLTVKYSQPIGITPISSEIPKGFSLSQNYPNPFNPTTNIQFAIPKTSIVKLSVYDVLGREVATLVNEQLQPGTYEINFDGTNFSSGVYFYQLISESYSETKKMLIIK